MGRRGWGLVATTLMMFAACGGDDGSGSGGGGTVLLSGTTCEGPVSFTLAGDERIVVTQRTGSTLIAGFLVLDGQLFDPDDDAAWGTYAQSNDVYMILGFDDDQPATPHTVTSLHDSFFAGRGAGVVGFVEFNKGESLTINAIDMTARTVDVDFTIPVFGSTATYPPAFENFVECPNTGKSITGSFSGSFELLTY